MHINASIFLDIIKRKITIYLTKVHNKRLSVQKSLSFKNYVSENIS